MMIDCTHCKYAEWHRTATGRLHPSGEGKCKFVFRLPLLPQSMYWLTVPSPFGGWINRKKELNDHCAYYAQVTNNAPADAGKDQ